ncbi:P-loop NTPase fold protein [Anabaena sp. UHCC 0451]|uniref:P-loop NTPase fold protein n=1 Tax=Anabaena sp. UHCC 0451 TaxID=2055235 RepID=UPI002B1F2E7A|nr:P-loop NTPase fold protein [Anabaena sp. UHCC 0451]MEA5576978.1 P-loop NTPase fold protein [Anabaena sp. UHCC 0451]
MNNNLDMFAKSTNPVNYGVNREEAESIIERFLDNENYRVLAVKGKWGVGKTHLVRSVLDEHQKNDYLYTSVFGISSIEHLKARIFANYQRNIKPNIKPINNVFEFINRNFGRVEKTPKILEFPKLHFGLSGSLLAIGGDLLLEIFFNLNINGNSIICIDDLERKSQLPLKDIFGFVEYLVQDFKCKIILIYNEDNLDKDSQTDLESYREKVIDKEFYLNPTVEENLDFIFKDYPHIDIIDVIKEVFKKSGTNNIRVIRKTIWLIDELVPLMKDWEESLRHQIITNVIVINIAKLDTEFCKRFSINGVDSMDTILSMSHNAQKYYDQYKEEDDKTAKEIFKLRLKIGEIGYINLERLDTIILKFIETSLLKDEEFIKEGQIFNKKEQRDQIIKKLDELSNHLYRFKCYNSFADNEQEITDGILSFMEENHLQLSWSQFADIKRFASMLELDISIYEKSLLETILKEISENRPYDLIELRNTLSKYPDLEASLNEKIKEYYQTLDITTTLENIINDDSYSKIQEYIDFLRNRTVNEYCEWLEKGHPNLINMIEWLLNSGYQPASQNLETAICILAECSRINKIRAKYLYNIDIDNQPHPENP